MADSIQVRRDVEADWSSNDPTLSAGEIGYVSDTSELVVGDGSTAFSSLDRVSLLGSGSTWQTYSPTLNASGTDPTLGSGSTTDGRYYRVGSMVVVHVDVTFGSSGAAAGSGNYTVSLPVSADTSLSFARVGSGLLRDDSGSSSYVAVANVSSASAVSLFTDSGQVSASSPFTWAADDWLRFMLVYEAA